MKAYFTRFFRLWALFVSVFFPLTILGTFQTQITQFLFGNLVAFINKLFFKDNIRVDFSSDSTSFFILVAILVLLALAFAFIKSIDKKAHFIDRFLNFYLGIILLIYGLDKVFKNQFYLPEPNILFTRFGNLDKDILFWSTMGVSYSYTVILGWIEVFVAFLLFIKKTRLLGAFFSIFIFGQIVILNFTFDISVKLFSSFLLLLSIFLSFSLVIKIKDFISSTPTNKYSNLFVSRLALSLKVFLIFLIILHWLEPAINRGNFNDDLVERPPYHGAYKNIDEYSEIKYLFFHRNKYLIFMDKHENMVDYKYSLNANELVVKDYSDNLTYYQIQYSPTDSILTLSKPNFIIHAKALDWRKMNALLPLFHLTIEDVE